MQAVLVEQRGATRVLTLNRPRVLNSLNLDMISRMAELFEEWEKDDSVTMILIKAAGRTFCAGGDLRMFYDPGKNNESWKEVVYKKYWMDYHLHTYRKQMVVIWQGMVIGGGAGFTLPSTCRIATENAGFCMPEVSLGHHTDCGGSYFLSRLPGFLGEYLALTGARLNSAEMLSCGLSTHFIPSKDISQFETCLLESDGDMDRVDSIVRELSVEPAVPEDSVLNRMSVINKCFCMDQVEGIIEALSDEKKNGVYEKWIDKTIEVLMKSSPTGLKQTLASIKKGRQETLRECFQHEIRLTLNILRATISEDLYEGIRAIIVDKDNCPKWRPESLAGVTDDKVELLFMPLKDEDELQLPEESRRWEGKWEQRIL